MSIIAGAVTTNNFDRRTTAIVMGFAPNLALAAMAIATRDSPLAEKLYENINIEF